MRPRPSFPLVVIVLVATSIPGLLAQARDVDVLLYLVAAARANAEHALPYAAAWIEKGPLAMAMFQVVDALFGRYSFPALSLLWLGLAAAGAWIARALAREAGCTWADGWASLAFVVGIGAVGGTLNTEVPAMVLAAAAVLSSCRREPPWRAGALAGAAFLCRQNAGAVLPILVGIELLRGTRAVRLAALAGAFLAPSALVLAGYAALGELDALVFCFWGYNTSIYVAATHVSGARLARIPWDMVVNFLWPIRTTAALALIGCVLAVSRARRGEGLAPLALFAAAAGLFVAVVPGLRFFSHYAALALPFLAALSALGLEAIVTRAHTRAALVVPLVAFSLGLELAPRGWLDTASGLASWVERGGPRRLGDPFEWPGRDEGVVPVAEFLRGVSAPDDRVFVWGMRPHVLVYADRLLATRFTTSTFLTGLVPWERVAPFEDTSRWIVPGAWDLLVADLARERPRWIVDASRDHLFGDGAYAPDAFPRLQEVLLRDYEQVFEVGHPDRYVVWKRR